MTAGKKNRPMRGRGGGKTDETFDASPDQKSSPQIGNQLNRAGSDNAGDKMKKGALNMWKRYIEILKQSFRAMDRYEQENLITKFCYVIAIGVAAIVMSCFYGLLPQMIRVIALPVFLAGGWFLGAKIVAPAMIKRLESHMNPPYE